MRAVVAPLFSAERDDRRLRAFAAEGSAPSMGWLALADLAAALTETRDDEVELLAGLAGGALGLRLRSVVTADGPLMLVDEPSTFRLLATIESMEDGPGTLVQVRALFEDAVVGAIVASVRGLPRAGAQRWMDEAGTASVAANQAELARMIEGLGMGKAVAEPRADLDRQSRHRPPLDPRGLARADAAAYVGVSPSLFIMMVDDGRMPKPRVANARRIWDRRELDAAIDELPHDGEAPGVNEWDSVLG